MRTLALAMVVAACAMSSGCGGDDDGGEAPVTGNGLGSGPYDPETCSPMAQQQTMVPAGCTQAELDEYVDCMTMSCEPTFRTCYGTDYRSGSYGGACKELLECATSRCKCNESNCIANCPGSMPCGQCFLDNPCGKECKIPLCGYRGALKDAGIKNLDKTCDDVLACCAAQPTPEGRKRCSDGINQIKQVGGANADLGCAPLFQIYAASAKSAPACQ